jgi:hypothetical protein
LSELGFGLSLIHPDDLPDSVSYGTPVNEISTPVVRRPDASKSIYVFRGNVSPAQLEDDYTPMDISNTH